MDKQRGALTLEPLDHAEYARFAEQQVHELARQYANAGDCSAPECLDRARAACSDLLADRLRGSGHTFLKAVLPPDRAVGWLWIGPPPALVADYGEVNLERARWLYQITIAESARGQGYGRPVLDALHARLASHGIQSVYLRVYDWNTAARRLYARAGYALVRQFPTDAHLHVSLLLSRRSSDADRSGRGGLSPEFHEPDATR